MRKNQLWKHIVCCLLAGTLIMGCLSGCGNQTKESKESSESKTQTQTSSKQEESKEPSKEEEEEVTLTMAWFVEAPITAHAADLSETAFGKAWQEATGINFEIVNMADYNAYNLMFASGEYPDIIWYPFYGYPGGPDAAVADGLIVPLNDYMEYAPNLQALFDKNDQYRKDSTTPNGNIMGFPYIRDDSDPSALYIDGISIRKDWLDELGLDYPKTAEEFYNVLKAFKEKKGAKYPLSSDSSAHFMSSILYGIITSPFGLVKGDFYQLDGQVHYGYAEKEYKDVLAWLNKLYEEELIDPNFAALDSETFNANVLNGVTGAGIVSCTTPELLTSAGKDTDPNFNFVGMPPLAAEDEDVAKSTQFSPLLNGRFAVITQDCENVEAAVKLLDYAYSEEGNMLFNYGTEGVSYEMVDGVAMETELITNHPEGWSAKEARAYYARGWSSGPYVQLYNSATTAENTRITKLNYSKSDAPKYAMPQLFFDEDVNAEISKYLSEIDTLRSEMYVKYVMGTESLDGFDEYVDTLYELGLDKVLAYYQEALDAYNAQ